METHIQNAIEFVVLCGFQKEKHPFYASRLLPKGTAYNYHILLDRVNSIRQLGFAE